jgi:hypothetical protein
MKLKIIGIIGFCLLLLIFTPNFVRASVSCQKEYYINGIAYINDTCTLNDEELEKDVYGSETGSGPKDMVLEDIIKGTGNPIPPVGNINTMDEICGKPEFQNYFGAIGNLPPQIFVDYVKGLGYDDEAHVAMLWNICNERKLQSTNNYINQNEENWRTDKEGISFKTVADIITNAVNWLLGKNPYPEDYEVQVAKSLDSYFASDKDTYYLLTRVNDLQLRVEALENSMDKIAAEEYCRGKLEVLVKYGLNGVKCGDTMYSNHQISPVTGEDVIIGITPVNDSELNLGGLIPKTEAKIEMYIVSLPSKIEPYNKFTLEVQVENTGNAKGTDKITLSLPNTWYADKKTETVTLDAGESKIIKFEITPTSYGGNITVSSSTHSETFSYDL